MRQIKLWTKRVLVILFLVTFVSVFFGFLVPKWMGNSPEEEKVSVRMSEIYDYLIENYADKAYPESLAAISFNHKNPYLWFDRSGYGKAYADFKPVYHDLSKSYYKRKGQRRFRAIVPDCKGKVFYFPFDDYHSFILIGCDRYDALRTLTMSHSKRPGTKDDSSRFLMQFDYRQKKTAFIDHVNWDHPDKYNVYIFDGQKITSGDASRKEWKESWKNYDGFEGSVK